MLPPKVNFNSWIYCCNRIFGLGTSIVESPASTVINTSSRFSTCNILNSKSYYSLEKEFSFRLLGHIQSICLFNNRVLLFLWWYTGTLRITPWVKHRSDFKSIFQMCRLSSTLHSKSASVAQLVKLLMWKKWIKVSGASSNPALQAATSSRFWAQALPFQSDWASIHDWIQPTNDQMCIKNDT